MASRETLYDQAMSCIERYAAAEVKSNDGQLDQVLDNLQEHMEFYCHSEARYKELEKLHSETINNMQQASSAEEAKKLCAIFDSKVKAIEKMPLTSNARLTEFLALRPGDDDEIRTVKTAKNVIDPISKKRMVDPVKNSMCGHSYEKSVVLQLIKKNPKTRCPIVGCSAQHFIQRNQLVPDDDLKRYLANTLDQSTAEDADNSQLISLDATL